MRFEDIQEGQDGYWTEVSPGEHLGPMRCMRKLPPEPGLSSRSQVKMLLPDGRSYWFSSKEIRTSQKTREIMEVQAQQRDVMQEMLAAVQDYTGPDFEYRIAKNGVAVIRFNVDSGRLLLWLLDLIDDPYAKLRQGQTIEKMLMRELRGKKVYCRFEPVNGRRLVGEMQINGYGASLLLAKVLEEDINGANADPLSLLH